MQHSPSAAAYMYETSTGKISKAAKDQQKTTGKRDEKNQVIMRRHVGEEAGVTHIIDYVS